MPPTPDPPRMIGKGRVLRYAVIADPICPTEATRHTVGGDVMGSFAALAIVQYEESANQGFYLLYLDAQGEEVTDTWHATLDDALGQAEFEYAGVSSSWVGPWPDSR